MKLSRRRHRQKTRQRKFARRNRFLRFESLELRQLLAGDITGAIYHDLNADGVRDQGEDGLANWTVYLDQNQNGSLDAGEQSALTDADGHYAFLGLTAGDYRVAEVVRGGWTSTNPTTGYTDITLADGQDKHVDFLNEGSGGTGAITGNVWRDLNADGIQDPEDTGIFGWTVFIDLNGDKVLDPNESFEVTDGDGNYTFTGILGGGPGDAISYEVQQVLPLGWEPAPNSNENYTADVVEGETFVGPDFANSPVEVSRVSGVVWNDLDGDGVRDTGEPGMSGWQVFADLNTNNALDTGEPNTTTTASGGYTLLGLEPGTVRIAEAQHINFKPTSPATGFQTVVAPNSGTKSGVNFGNQERTDAAIGGVIYVDRDHDGARDPGEEGLPGITVYIDDNDNGSLDAGERSAVTTADLFYTPDVDEAGTYRFEKLAAGTYLVRQIVPAELTSTPIRESEHSVTVGPTDDRSDIDGGDRYRPSEIHGIKFEDINGNGSHDSGEPGLEGVTIFIDLNRNNILDTGEPTTTTGGTDGSYSFTGLEAGAYVVREVVPAGFIQTFPETVGGILWPEGVSNPAVGNVTPTLIQVSLAQGETHTQRVSLTLPTTGALTDMVDVFLLFDDTGSFTFNSPIVRAAFPNIISELQTRLPGIDLGFGVGRLEEYGNFAAEYSTGRPFVLNQPVISSSPTGYTDTQVLTSIQAALDRVVPGYGGDRPETVIEALYQMVTGTGFDGNDNGSLLDSGAAGLASTQVNPGNSGDVPSFASFTADPTNGVLPASGTIGGAGFRSGALPIIITATDTGFAYQPKGETTITGVDGLTLPASNITHNGRGTTPFSSGAGIQETVTGLNALGALVVGLGTNDPATSDPRIGLEALANLTGAINRTTTSIANGTPDPIDPGDPFYFKIGTGGDPLVGNIADGIVAAIDGAVTSVNVNVTLRASDPRVHITFSPGVINGLGAGDTATFDVTFTGDGRPHRFDLQFVREGTDVVLGSIPVVLGTPIEGDGYEYEDCDDGVICLEANFGNQRTSGDFVVSRTSVAVDEGGSNTFSVNLAAQPTSDVTATVSHTAGDSDLSVTGGGTLTFTSANWNTPQTVTVGAAEDDDTANGSATITVASTGLTSVDVTASEVDNDTPEPGGTKFFVVDQSRRRTFEYDADGNSLESSGLNKEDEGPRGIAASPDGSTLWVVDIKGEVFVYDSENQLLGSWEFEGIDKPEGITVHGDDLWIVDREEDRVYRFEGGALRRSGEAEPTSSFRLDRDNRNPMDLVTDGTHIWVVNNTRRVDKVFRYTVSGTLEGSWQIDAANAVPTGLTIDPNDVDHIWIVDSGSDRVYQYDGATGRTAGQQAANPIAIFALDRANRNPQGIADPQSFRTAHSTTSQEIGSEIEEAYEWHNDKHAEDVNGDEAVTPMDALLVINNVNEHGAHDLKSRLAIAAFLDVNDDGFLSPGDALQVINYLGSPVPTPAQHDAALLSIAGEIDSAVAGTTIVDDSIDNNDANTQSVDDAGTPNQGSGDDTADDQTDGGTDGDADSDGGSDAGADGGSDDVGSAGNSDAESNGNSDGDADSDGDSDGDSDAGSDGGSDGDDD